MPPAKLLSIIILRLEDGRLTVPQKTGETVLSYFLWLVIVSGLVALFITAARQRSFALAFKRDSVTSSPAWGGSADQPPAVLDLTQAARQRHYRICIEQEGWRAIRGLPPVKHRRRIHRPLITQIAISSLIAIAAGCLVLAKGSAEPENLLACGSIGVVCGFWLRR